MKQMDFFGNSGISSKEKRRNISYGDDVVKEMGNLDTGIPVFGIDLGTTNSAISLVAKGDSPTVIKLDSGKYTMPSCVMWKDGKFIVGDEAYRHREMANVIYSVKRWMQNPLKTVMFRDGSKTLEMRPAEVSAEILKALVAKTKKQYGEIKDVIVTVPAYFDQNGRTATREACELAGLNLIDMINEPTAAALCYDVGVLDGANDFITFDFGGGTLDVTLARISADSPDDNAGIYDIDDSSSGSRMIQCLAIEGDSHLGGDNIDMEMLQLVGKKVESATGVPLSNIPIEYREDMLLRLEKYKKQDVRGIYRMFIDTVSDRGQAVSCSIIIDESDFKAALAPVYKECKKILDTLIAKAPNNARTVLLVGGSTKNPLMVERLKADYPGYVFSNALDQDLAVSEGAAIKGKIAKFGEAGVQIFDILPIAIGVNEEGINRTILKSGAVLPAVNSWVFTTVVDNQREMELEILQGKSSLASECVSLGKLLFEDIAPAPAGEAKLSVTLSVGIDSLLTCSGTVNGETKRMKLSLTGSSSSSGVVDKDERMRKIWLTRSETMPDEDKEVFRRMVENYPQMFSRKDINLFLKQHTKSLKSI